MWCVSLFMKIVPLKLKCDRITRFRLIFKAGRRLIGQLVVARLRLAASSFRHSIPIDFPWQWRSRMNTDAKCLNSLFCNIQVCLHRISPFIKWFEKNWTLRRHFIKSCENQFYNNTTVKSHTFDHCRKRNWQPTVVAAISAFSLCCG